jgi:hypothetical protein
MKGGERRRMHCTSYGAGGGFNFRRPAQMNASDHLQIRRNRVLFENRRELAPFKLRAACMDTGLETSIRLQRLVGEIETGPLPPLLPSFLSTADGITAATLKTADMFLGAVDGLLSAMAAANAGPTRTSRTVYLWFTGVVGAYNWVAATGRLTGLHDGWSWDTRYVLTDRAHSALLRHVWLIAALETVMPAAFPAATATAARAAAAAAAGISAADYSTLETFVRSTGHFDEWKAAWNAWYAARQLDGYVAAATPPVPETLPNGATVLEVAATVDPATFPQPSKWTPLKVGAKTQSYLTYGWLDVSSSCLTAEDDDAIQGAARASFPASDGARAAEIAEVVAITGALTDAQKVSAEFWAGGPHTVSPPGMFVWFWRTYVDAIRLSESQNISVLLYSGFDLAQHLFETGRLVWGLKKEFLQARPIQEIRRLYRGTMLIGYDGVAVDGASWVPYQESNFVTPPFADFPSGHSAFSRSFANVMMDWFGPTIAEKPVTLKGLALLSPAFGGAASTQTTRFGHLTFPAGASHIQPSIVPALPTELAWSSWADMATSAGLSRKYGGIHATSAHVGSVALADALHGALRSRFALDVVRVAVTAV